MSDTAKHDLGPRSGIKIILDGRLIRVPEDARGSLASIRDFLEVVAMHQERTLSRFAVDGFLFDLKAKSFPPREFREIRAESTSFMEISRQMIHQACLDLHNVKSLAQTASAQILINDWPQIQKQWRDWLPELKSPLLILQSIQELCGRRIDELTVDGITLAAQRRRFPIVLGALQQTYQRANILDLSEALDHMYLPWLESLLAFLELLDRD